MPGDNFKLTKGEKHLKTNESLSNRWQVRPSRLARPPTAASQLRASFAQIAGPTLFRWGDAFGGKDGMRIIKAGILDDGRLMVSAVEFKANGLSVNVINNTKPGAELFAPERIKWVAALDGAGSDGRHEMKGFSWTRPRASRKRHSAIASTS